MGLKSADRLALVSGSTKGIGFAIATSLAREGARVIVHGRTAREEVANLVVYVCSPLSSATNGAALRVDGGVARACF